MYKNVKIYLSKTRHLFFNELHCYILVSSTPTKTLEETEI